MRRCESDVRDKKQGCTASCERSCTGEAEPAMGACLAANMPICCSACLYNARRICWDTYSVGAASPHGGAQHNAFSAGFRVSSTDAE